VFRRVWPVYDRGWELPKARFLRAAIAVLNEELRNVTRRIEELRRREDYDWGTQNVFVEFAGMSRQTRGYIGAWAFLAALAWMMESGEVPVFPNAPTA